MMVVAIALGCTAACWANMRIAVSSVLLAASFFSGLAGTALEVASGERSCSRLHDCAEVSIPGPAEEAPSGTPSPRTHISGALQECKEIGVDVTAALEIERDLACAAAHDALQLLGQCKVPPRTRLSIRVSGKARHPQKGDVFGFFDGRTAIVASLSEATTLAIGTPYELLSASVFYKSLVVHEIVHAIMSQNYLRQPQTRAAFEYPSYVMQFASLPTAAREALLVAMKSTPNPRGFIFSDILLAMDPVVFAASAYEHFSTAADSCGYLTALLKGEVDFIAMLPL